MPLRARCLLVIICILLAACGDDGDGSRGTGSSFVDPTGEYTITVNQTTDTCRNQVGQINWGGATLRLEGDILVAVLPESPGSPICREVQVPYIENTARFVGTFSTMEGTCQVDIDVDISLLFTEAGFTGTYVIGEEAISGDCSSRPSSCERIGTLSGDPGLGSPPCP